MAIVAIDNGGDRMVFVGPVSTYYEFTSSASQRMTDEEFSSRIQSGNEPDRPGWIKAFDPLAK
ncbi:MAG TPA: DUF3160 domain-containing protein [Pirellulales bacterium]|nr:DUF3160 domain-containing protein [Pirellulales bacterium]